MTNPIDLKAIRRKLETERDLLQERIVDVTKLLDTREEHLTEVIDAAEAASERQLQSTLLSHSQQHLQEIETALRRLDAGTYGLCEHCGKPIRPERLGVLPYATICFKCQTQREQASR
jgi:DnaK suppressor protein